MIVDLILDRKDGVKYDARDFYADVMNYFYNDVMSHNHTSNTIARIAMALDCGEEEDIKRALCRYIKENEYNLDICNYINSVNWLDEE